MEDIVNNSNIDFLSQTLESFSSNTIRSSTSSTSSTCSTAISHDLTLRLLSILGTLSPSQLQILYHRVWKRPHSEFEELMGVDSSAFQEWLNNPTSDKSHLSVFNYFKFLIKQSTMSTLRSSLIKQSRQSPKFVLFLDYDNYGVALKTLLTHMPNKNFITFVIAVAARGAHSKIIDSAQQCMWFHMVHASVQVKDAADHCLTFSAVLANEILSVHTVFYMLSLDRFVEELASQLVDVQPDRKVVILTPNSFRDIVSDLSGTSPYPYTNDLVSSLLSSEVSIEDTAGYSQRSIPVNVLSPFSHSFQQRFRLYAELLQSEFVSPGKLKPLLSLVGSVMKQKGIGMERGGLKSLTNEAVLRGVVIRVGELSLASIYIFPDRLQAFLQDTTVTDSETNTSKKPTLSAECQKYNLNQ